MKIASVALGYVQFIEKEGGVVSLPVFLELVEIKAKTASVLPFLLGVSFSAYVFHSVNVGLMACFFVAMLLFNMAVDILDNYNHYYQAVDTVDYQKNTNIIGRENLNPRLVLALLLTFIFIAGCMGLVMVAIVGWQLLLLGVICFAVGILYSSGPMPIADLPLGEVFSGVTMGYLIPVITVWLNIYQTHALTLGILAQIFVVALPNTLWIANLMLANNLCDLQEDEANKRYTLVHYIGVRGGLYLFSTLNVIALGTIAVGVWLHLAPVLWLASWLLIPFIIKQTKRVWNKQVKRETFPCAVKILALGSLVVFLSYTIGIFL